MDGKLTEDHIKDTAKRIFFAKGQLNAKMHEIAKEAGVNKALLHYYFRSREKLFEVVLKEAMNESFIKMFTILSSELPFEEKIEEAVNHLVDKLSEYPFIESFIISEINKNPENGLMVPPVMDAKHFTKKFLKEIQNYIDENSLSHIKPENFLVNMMALCSYPSSTKPIIQNIFGYSEEQYKTFIKNRKRTLTKIILMKS